MGKDEFRIPIKITPDPIRDSVVEIRFKSEVPNEAIFGKLFNLLNKEFPSFENIAIPENIKKQVIELKHVAIGRLQNDNFSIGIGNNVVAFNCVDGYKGWEQYFAMIKSNLLKIKETGIINEIERIGIRFTNFFEGVDDISSNLTLRIDFEGKEDYKTEQTTFRTELLKDEFHYILMVANNAKMGTISGSVLDIDTSISELPNVIDEELFKIIDKGRQEEKILFFKLLKPDFLEQFNPEYE